MMARDPIPERRTVMTKARARERAKAKAGGKAKQHHEGNAAGAGGDAGPSGPKAGAGHFDAGAGSIKKPGAAAGRSFAEMRRGATRSR
jgi:hypothetical protein